MRLKRLIFGTLLTLALTLIFSLPTTRSAIAQVGVAVKNGFAGCSGVNCDNVFTIGGTGTVASGGTLTVASGGTLAIDSTATVTGLVTGPSNASYKVARGTITLDGSNPSSATTGLTAIVACTVTNKRSTAPGLDPTDFTIATAAVAGRLDVYAWKPTASGDATLIASTDNDDTIDWVCVGT